VSLNKSVNGESGGMSWGGKRKYRKIGKRSEKISRVIDVFKLIYYIKACLKIFQQIMILNPRIHFFSLLINVPIIHDLPTTNQSLLLF
jgi:hypothetical protein